MGEPDGSAGSDGASQARCDPEKPFDTPTLVQNINSPHEEYGFPLTNDEKTAFIGHNTWESPDTLAIYSSQRPSAAATFTTPDDHITSAINAAGNVLSGSPSRNGLLLYFHRQNRSMVNDIAIFPASRASDVSSFDAGTPVTVGGVALTGAIGPKISVDGTTLYGGLLE